jgi:hypothetical protein
MKKIFVLSLLLFFATASFAQQSAPKQHWTETDYYKKSKKQKTAAWIFTGVGSAVLFTTLIAEAVSVAVTLGQDKATGSTLPYTIGAASVVTGIVLFVASGKNKKKAKATSAFFKMEKASVLQETVFSNQSFPALGLKISF